MMYPGKKFTRIVKAATALLCMAITPSLWASESTLDPTAVARLQASMDYVSKLQNFSLLSTSTIEVVLEDGQKLQFDNAIKATVQRPNKFHAVRLGDLVDQEFFYDGQTLTLQDSTAGFHATVDAPDTLEGMLDFARDSLDIVAPAGDLIYSDAFEKLMDGVTSAMNLGPAYVEGQICDHLAFSAPEHQTDWQIWVQRGEKPLPCRIVITSREILNAPQFAVHIREWDLDPDSPKQLFEFNEQDSSTEIEFILVNASDSQ